MQNQAVPPTFGALNSKSVSPQRLGWSLLIVGFGAFLAWALLAPLDSGVSASGSVVVTGNRKSVQSLVPGKIAAIFARDGEPVVTGQVVVRLDDTQSRSQFDIAKGQLFTSLATEARLVAERSGRQSIDFPEALTNEATDPRAVSALALQAQLFATRRESLNSEIGAMAENIRGQELLVAATEASRQAKQDQQRILSEQLKNLRDLADEGFLPRNRVLDQERTISAMLGAIAEDAGNIGRSRQLIAEMKIRMILIKQNARKDVESHLSEVQRDASTLRSKLEGLQFDVFNTEIKSPATGLVMSLTAHTIGGVVAVGSVLMEVVPRDEVLKVDAQIAPHLIDKIKPGLEVDILFTALDQVSTPKIEGRLVHVSADVLIDPRSNLPYFKASIEVTAQGMDKLKQNKIVAGMPAEVLIRTGERTAMNYLLKPLSDRLRRSATEP